MHSKLECQMSTKEENRRRKIEVLLLGAHCEGPSRNREYRSKIWMSHGRWSGHWYQHQFTYDYYSYSHRFDLIVIVDVIHSSWSYCADHLYTYYSTKTTELPRPKVAILHELSLTRFEANLQTDLKPYLFEHLPKHLDRMIQKREHLAERKRSNTLKSLIIMKLRDHFTALFFASRFAMRGNQTRISCNFSSKLFH